MRGSIRAAEALRLFEACRKRWTYSFNGQVGLDICQVERVADLEGLDFRELYPLVIALEDAWLALMDEKRREEKARADAKAAAAKHQKR